MIDNAFLEEWLEGEIVRVVDKIKAGTPLDIEDKWLMVLKVQANCLARRRASRLVDDRKDRQHVQ